ncbi:MAG: hypothetical protein P9M14_11260 [Candidatus Alcyoniella australis]|nr:hypothetical protein [Candidatus Alcyoniella australis]
MPKDERKHIESSLAAQSLVDRRVIAGTGGEELPLLPKLWLAAVGGSVFDAGAAPLKALADKAAELINEHQLALSCGGGVRERHVLSIGLELGLPAGGLAAVAGGAAEQNALMLWALLAQRGGVRLPKDEIELLPTFLALGKLPILTSYPPYEYWEFPPERGNVPMHGCDCGALLLAETLGCSLLLLKDVPAIYDADPRRNPQAQPIERLNAAGLAALDQGDGPLEPLFARILKRCRRVRQVRLISGLEPGPLERCVRGEPEGTALEPGDA